MARENRVMQTQLIRNQTFSFGKKEKSGFVCTLQQEKNLTVQSQLTLWTWLQLLQDI